MTIDDRLGSSGSIDPRIWTSAAVLAGALGGSIPIASRGGDGDA